MLIDWFSQLAHSQRHNAYDTNNNIYNKVYIKHKEKNIASQ